MINQIISDIEINKRGKVFLKEEMKKHTSIRVGGKVSVVFIPNTIDDLKVVLKYLTKEDIPFQIIGRGSNIIFTDDDVELFVIKISQTLNYLEIFNDGTIKVGAGYSFQTLARKLSKKGYSGLEFAGGIPGAVGGAICMNAGAHTGDTAAIVKSVTTVTKDGELKTYTKEECQFSYRNSIFQKNGEVIVEATFKLTFEERATVFKRMSGNLAYREEMQPLSEPSFGSAFRNPPHAHSGKLIEDCGLKGLTIGGAQISEKHANFIINKGDAKAKDILDLIKHIQDLVYAKTNIVLETEVKVIGVDSEER